MNQFKKTTSYFSAILIGTLLTGCAEERSIEPMADGNRERYAKSIVTKSMSEQELQARNLAYGGNVWFHKVSIVKTSGPGLWRAGFQGATKAGFFRFTKDEIRFENAVNADLNNPNKTSELLSSWDIEHSEARLDEVDGRPTNREEEDNFRPWYQKSHFIVDWGDISMETSNPCYSFKGAQLVQNSQEVTEDYIGFTVAVDYDLTGKCPISLRRRARGDFTFSMHMKYSFVRAKKSDYIPMVYSNEFDPLLKKYGYFNTIVENKSSGPYLWENTITVDRFHPNKTHTYYFTKNYPEKYKWYYTDPKVGIFPKTNKLFGEQGLNNYDPKTNTCTEGLCFEIKDNDGTKEFGDLRYSFIQVYEDLSLGGLLGYGPHDPNPFTGEILAGTVVMFPTDFKYIIERLALMIEKQQDNQNFEESTLMEQMARVLKTEDQYKPKDYPEVWTQTSKVLAANKDAYNAYFDTLDEFTYGFPLWSTFTRIKKNDYLPTGLYRSGGDKITEELGQVLFPSEDLNQAGKSSLAFEFLQNPKVRDVLTAARQEAAHMTDHMDPWSSTRYDSSIHVPHAFQMLKDGKSKQEVLDILLYWTAFHEFGHNLNLRHNFYGSVDHRNFRAVQVEVTDPETGVTRTQTRHQPMSSVMEYPDMTKEYYVDDKWEPYDEAALVYAYSGGKIDLAKERDTKYLLCMDEHRVHNALCNTGDAGFTPAQIALHQIESYDRRYEVINRRFGRPYWDTSGYSARMISTMRSMKEFLGLMQEGMTASKLRQEITKTGKVNSQDLEVVVGDILNDIYQSNILSVAFYDAVLQTRFTDKNYKDELDEWSGEVTRLGIGPDKIFSMLFLMGDTSLWYNPNESSPYFSYLSYLEGTPLSPTIETAMENIFTSRLDMEPGFESFGRVLFANNAYNFFNRSKATILDRIRVDCFSPQGLKQQLGVDPVTPSVSIEGKMEPLRWGIRKLESGKVTAPYYQNVAGTGEQVGIVAFGDNYYVAKELDNRYSFRFIETMIDRSVKNTRSLEPTLASIRDSYVLYWTMKQGEVPECR